jgi:hypothetical protein
LSQITLDADVYAQLFPARTTRQLRFGVRFDPDSPRPTVLPVKFELTSEARAERITVYQDVSTSRPAEA